jgi:hypothetical protein
MPLIQRFYDWEMQYNPDELIRSGDLKAKVGGATERIDKQVKAQDIERLIGLASSDPQYMKHIDADAAFRELAATTRAGDIILPLDVVRRKEQEEAEAAANAPPDPQTIQAEAKAREVEAKIKIEEMRLQMEGKMAEAEFEKEMIQIELQQQEIQGKVAEQQMIRELELIKMAAEQGKTQAQMAQALNISIMTETTKRLLKEADMQKFREEIAIKRETGEGI